MQKHLTLTIAKPQKHSNQSINSDNQKPMCLVCRSPSYARAQASSAARERIQTTRDMSTECNDPLMGPSRVADGILLLLLYKLKLRYGCLSFTNVCGSEFRMIMVIVQYVYHNIILLTKLCKRFSCVLGQYLYNKVISFLST